MRKKFVIYEDEKRDLSGISEKLQSKIPGCEVVRIKTNDKPVKDPDCVFISVEMRDFEQIYEKASSYSLNSCVFAVVFSDTPYNTASKVISSGIHKYMVYPDDFDNLDGILKMMSAVSSKGGDYGIIGSSPSIQAVNKFIEKAAPVSLSVLIEGESGTGKELVAKAIYEKSSRASNTFVAINCIAFAKELVENELFGHEPGAFSGATGVKKGLFEIADKGTLFIDEIGDMEPGLQGKLLRVLETGKFRRLGGVKELSADVRIIAATNRILENDIQDGKFRLDLFYRLGVLRLFIPPLRERWADIPELAEYFIRKGGYDLEFEPAALELLQDYSWPGNARELKNTVDRCATMSAGRVIKVNDLPEQIKSRGMRGPAAGDDLNGSLDSFVENMEKELLLRAMAKFNGRKTEVAKALKVSRFTLYRKLEKYGIKS